VANERGRDAGALRIALQPLSLWSVTDNHQVRACAAQSCVVDRTLNAFFRGKTPHDGDYLVCRNSASLLVARVAADLRHVNR
jgi:hypothetical protein